MKIGKLDAAKHQIETAVKMYFNDGDPISIHTLTGAAYQILKDINGHIGGKPMLIEQLLDDIVIPEFKNEVFKKIYEAENFFKHADRDPEAEIGFNPQASEAVLWEACIKYSELSGEQTPVMQTMHAWFQLQHPQFFIFEDWRKKLLEECSGFSKMLGKEQFFDKMLPFLEQRRIAGKFTT